MVISLSLSQYVMVFQSFSCNVNLMVGSTLVATEKMVPFMEEADGSIHGEGQVGKARDIHSRCNALLLYAFN